MDWLPEHAPAAELGIKWAPIVKTKYSSVNYRQYFCNAGRYTKIEPKKIGMLIMK